MSYVTNPPARVAPAASKVAPASREAIPPGSADPPGTSAVCAVDAELRTVLPGTDMMEEPLNNCSSICSGEGSPETLGRLPSRCSGLGDSFAAPLCSVVLCRLMASKTLPIDSPHHSLCNLCVLCVSVVNCLWSNLHHRDTENTEVAQRRILNPYHQ